MMGFKIVIFALLLISLQQAVGDSSKSISSDDVYKIGTAEQSHHHHHRRGLMDLILRIFKRKKNKDNSKTQFSSNMKWGTYQENQENLVSVSMKGKEDNNYYISRENNCEPSFVDTEIHENVQFLVNPDNIENLEWKPVSKHKILQVIPPFTVETCNGYIIARNDQGLGYITAKNKTINIKKLKDSKAKLENLEVLTINFENIKEEYLTNVQFDAKSVQRNKKPSMFKNLTVVNNNCNAMKQMVKINNYIEETASFQTGNTLLIGGTLGVNKANVKVEVSGTEAESNSGVKKTGLEYTQELDIPPSCSCNLVIDRTVFVTTVPFTADLTRVYKNDDVRTASVDGTYTYQESSEIKTNFESCTKLSNNKC